MATRQTNFQRNKELELKFDNTVRSILARQFIVRDVKADLEEGTDFLIYSVQPFRVGVRLRRFHIYPYYNRQFTIRWEVASGVRTEIDKIYDGLVDYIFYGFVNLAEDRIVQYIIGDLSIFRAEHPEPYQIKYNGRGDSHLAAFRIPDMPKDFVIKSWKDHDTIADNLAKWREAKGDTNANN